MNALLTEMTPAILALVVVVGLAALAFSARRRLSAEPTRTEFASARREKAERVVERALVDAVKGKKRERLQPGVVGEVVDGFDVEGFMDHARELFRTVQQTRADPDREALLADFLEGALDVALGSGPGLESTADVLVTEIRPTKIGGTQDGCEVEVFLQAILVEVRNGAEHLVEVDERWHFGWPPGRKVWRVMQVERLSRRNLEPAVLNPEAVAPATRAQVSPTLRERLESVDFEAVEAAAYLALPAWAEAVSSDTPAALEGLALPGFQESIHGLYRRHAYFGQRLEQTITIDELTPARVLHGPAAAWATVWATGSIRERLVHEDGTEGEPLTLPWARYLTFREGADGAWLLAWQEDDEAWVV